MSSSVRRHLFLAMKSSRGCSSRTIVRRRAPDHADTIVSYYGGRTLTTLPRNQPFDRNSLKGEFGKYAEHYDLSISDPDKFWGNAAESLSWFEKPKTIMQEDAEIPNHIRWFPDGKINTSYNCLDRHIEERGSQDALIYDSPVTSVKQKFSYQELLEQVSLLAGALKDDLNVEVGDRVLIYMPMIPQAVIAMLACARIGAVHSVVFGGFASHELASRITDCQPKVVITASAGVEPSRVVPYKPLLEKALDAADHSVERVVVVQRKNVQECKLDTKIDVDYDELMAVARPADAVPLLSTDPHYILYTSGTTGLPKGVLRDTGGYATALKYSMDTFYGMKPGDVFWAASDLGWAVGHSYIVYGPLLHGCTSILYEGKPVGTPDAGAFWRVISEYGVNSFFTAPTAFRAIKQVDPAGEFAKQYDLSSMRSLFLAGEHCDPETIHWCEKALPGAPPPVDHWWQTELGWPAVGNAVGLGRVPTHYGSCAMPVPGFKLNVFDDEGNQIEPNTLGNMAIKLPLPPGSLSTIYKDNERFQKGYLSKYPGYYETGDAAYLDEDGYVYIMGRTDDVINTAGHRLSTGSMEEILMAHPKVADCAVIPVHDEIKGQVPVGFVTLISGTDPEEHDAIRSELIALVREEIGPVASFKKCGFVSGLPKTRSGKILRGTMSKIANGEPYKITPTVEDPKIFDTLEPVIQELMGVKKQ